MSDLVNAMALGKTRTTDGIFISFVCKGR